jgi:hypothetical protein
MRTVFTLHLHLLVVTCGLVYFSVVGMMHR